MKKFTRKKFHLANILTIVSFLLIIGVFVYLFTPERTTEFRPEVFHLAETEYSEGERVTLVLNFCRYHKNTVDVTYELVGEQLGLIDTKKFEGSKLPEGCFEDVKISTYVLPEGIVEDKYFLRITLQSNAFKFNQPPEQYRTEYFYVKNNL